MPLVTDSKTWHTSCILEVGILLTHSQNLSQRIRCLDVFAEYISDRLVVHHATPVGLRIEIVEITTVLQ